MENKCVLAMYDVRGKQKFIFSTNKLQEIIGASWIIRDVFADHLYKSAEAVGGEIIKNRDPEGKDIPFSSDDFVARINTGNVLGEVIYEAGGNCLLLFKDRKTFQDVTYEFTKRIAEEIGTLHVLGTCVDVTEGFSNFKEDYKELYRVHRRNEAQESNISPWSCLPIVQVDRKNSQPLVNLPEKISGDNEINKKMKGIIAEKGVYGKLTKDSIAKLVKYYSEIKRITGDDENKLTEIERDYYKNNEDMLDNLVTEKGIDSQLAVIYIDGNNMGSKLQEATSKNKYDDSIRDLREFSKNAQKIYVDEGIKAALGDLGESKDDKVFRIVVSAGDEVNFIVNAHDAFRCARNYLDYLREKEDASACAGIAVFHSHAPYADVYRIAEEACESGKQKMKEVKLEHASFIDFHICQGAIGTSLDEIREEENGKIISRPWLMWKRSEPKDKDTQIIDFESMVRPKLRLLKEFARTNIKGLAKAAKEGKVSLKMELSRMFGHSSEEEQKKNKDKYELLIRELDKNEEVVRGIIYDLAISYDMWFSGKEV